jgi:hypothetical protein
MLDTSARNDRTAAHHSCSLCALFVCTECVVAFCCAAVQMVPQYEPEAAMVMFSSFINNAAPIFGPSSTYPVADQ